jgi:hypothetical protein
MECMKERALASAVPEVADEEIIGLLSVLGNL